MLALVRTELLKLTTTRLPVGLCLAAPVLAWSAAVISLVRAGRDQNPSIGTTPAVLAALGGLSRTALIAMILGGLVIATESRHGTLTGTALRSPRRIRLATAKAITAVLIGAGMGVTAMAGVLLVTAAAGALAAPLLTADIAARCLGLLLTYPAYALIGLGVASMLPRFQTAALILPVAWVGALEPLVLTTYAHHVPAWSITGVSAAAADALDVTPLFPVWAGVLGLATCSGALWALGATHLIRSDIG